MATIKDIAKLSGYSVGTVSRVINNHPDVSEAARERIQKIIEKENYQPNENAKMLKQSHTSAIAIIVKGTDNLFLNTILEKVQFNLRENGEEASVIFLRESENEVAFALQLCLERNPKGLVFLGGDLENFRNGFEKIKTPSVLVAADASALCFSNLSSFSTDDYAGAREAVKLLVEKGHRNIMIIGGFDSFEEKQVTSSRVMGAVSVFEENGIVFDRHMNYMESVFSMKNGYENMRRALKRNPDLTAVFALGDMIAIGAMRAVRDEGFKVPDDISIIGFDGVEYGEYTIPRLATIRQDTAQLAKKSVDDLLFRISYPRMAVHESIPFEVVRKYSVKSIR